MTHTWITKSAAQTEALGAQLSPAWTAGTVVALFGGMGVGKTAFVRGVAAGRGIPETVSSPTFALVHDYGGTPPLLHFDMYRVQSWEDLYTTGFFEYLEAGGILVVEWSENIESALPANALRFHFTSLNETVRQIEME